MHLLEEVGIQFPSKKALEIFSDCGAWVNMEKQIVSIPPDVVERAMSTAPATPLGALVVGEAEVASGMALIQ